MDPLLLRIHATGGLYQGRDAIVGTISGLAKDVGEPPFSVTADVEVVIGTPAAVMGGVAVPIGSNTTSTLVTGRIDGSIQFRDSQGNAGSCTAIIWLLCPPA